MIRSGSADRSVEPARERVGLVVCPEARIYDHGPAHPLRPDRVLLTWLLIETYGLDRLPNVERLGASAASDQEIGLVHTAEFIDATRRAGHGEEGPWWRYGYGPGDNPIFPQMHEAGAWVVGASLAAARAVWSGERDHVFNAAGGLHHAMASRASGFCVYDDPAAAIAWLLAQGAERIAYVDVDVHHGDGVQALFYDDPRVLTISIHESGEYLFPGTGFIGERGSGEAAGTKVNVPLPPGTGDEGWLRAFREIVPPIVESFEPAVLVTQLGCDTHVTDPIAHLRLTTYAYREAARELHRLAHAAAGGRWIATGGGGYEWARVVPRAWTIYFAEMCGEAELEDQIPGSWIEEARRRSGPNVPDRLFDPPGDDRQESPDVGPVVEAVRRSAFPYFGIRSS